MGKRASHSTDGGALTSRPVAGVRNSVPLKLFMLNFNRRTKVLAMDGTLQIKPENLLNLGKYYVGTVQFQLSLTVRNIPTMLCLGAKLFQIVIYCANLFYPGFS